MKVDSVAAWLRRKPRVLIILAFVLALLAAYLGSYLYLSRRGMREAKALRMTDFRYIPVEEALQEEDLSWHTTLALFYAPANAVDQALTGADGPIRCILFRLSKQGASLHHGACAGR